MLEIDRPTWQLILIAAEKLKVQVGDFRLDQIIEAVQLLNPQLDRTSIQPVVQGMTSNAGKGPPSPCGKPLVRVRRGIYRLSANDTAIPSRNSIVNPGSHISQLVTSKRINETTQADSESLNRGYLEFQEGQNGVSFDYLFGPYVRGARQITVIDPYIRIFYQAKNMMEFIETVRKSNSDDSEITVRLITIKDKDPEKAAKQQELLIQVQVSASTANIKFVFEFDESRTLHDREVSTDSGWKIVLGRGLDIFQYVSNDAFEMAGRIQSLRKIKKFGISYIETQSTQILKPVDSTVAIKTAKAKEKLVAVAEDETEFEAADILLISCVKTKLIHAAAAKDLFISPLFRKERAYAESNGAPWYILSAENGLVTPDQQLDPYENFLPRQSAEYRKTWGDKVISQLEKREGPIQGKIIEIHAGVAYIDAIRSGLLSRGAIINEPLRGMSFGKRLQWYSNDACVRQIRVRPVSSELLPDVASLVASLRDESLAVSPNNFHSAGSVGRKVSGMYSWWVDAKGAQELSNGLGHLVPFGLLYVGLAGATHWPSGKQSSNTLWSRIESMHLGAKHEFSTLRRSIGSILSNLEGRKDIDEVALTRWMELHLRVLVVPYEDADTLGKVEQAVLAELNPPLNLKGMPDSALRSQLKELRRAVAK